MLDQKSAAAAKQELGEMAQKRTNAGAPAQRKALSADEVWARKSLRWRDGKPVCDLANVIRILENHPDFKGRFKFNEILGKVLDKGAVMVEWRLNEVCAVIQERFIPEVSTDAVSRSLVIVANRCNAKP